MKTTRRNLSGAAFILVLAITATLGTADDLRVPGQYSTIQGAIDAASDGDDVIVAPGRYHELIDLKGKAITLRSVNPSNQQVVAITIIDGTGAGPVVRCVNGEGLDSVISGFTITGGHAERGAGIFNDAASPTVMRCRFVGNAAEIEGGGMSNINGSNPHVQECSFTENTAEIYGGGIFNDQSAPCISGCTFENNSAVAVLGTFGRASTRSNGGTYGLFVDGDPPPRGGGIFSVASSPTVTDCTFTGNTATYGGGMAIHHESHSTVSRCTFTENSATERGGGIVVSKSDPIVTDCTLSGNSARFGGGVSISGNSSGTLLSRCRFSSNTAGLRGGGLHITDLYQGPMIVNSVFNGNSSEDDGGGIYTFTHTTIINTTFSGNVALDTGGGIRVALGTTTLVNCVLWGDAPNELYLAGWYGSFDVENSVVQGGFAGLGNLDMDPQFVNAAEGDLRLTAGSPCIDAGDNTAVPAGILKDLDGNDRFIDDPDTIDTGNGAPPIVDMGAYEFQGPPAIDASLDIHPGECPNSLNPQSHGKLPAAISGMAAVDVTGIDPLTLLLSRADGVGGEVSPLMGPPGPGLSVGDVTSPFEREGCDCDDSGSDGLDDLQMKFDVQAVASSLALDDVPAGDTVELLISGQLLDGTPFEASDCVLIVGPGDLNFDGRTDTADLLVLLGRWGDTTDIGDEGDLSENGVIDVPDLLLLLAEWT